MGVWVPVPLVMDGKIGTHPFGNKKLPAVVPEKVNILFRGKFSRNSKNYTAGKLGVPLFFNGFSGVP